MEIEKGEKWYSDAREYWDTVPPTVDGMLGGFEVLTEPDVRDSFKFINVFVNGDAAKGKPARISTNLCCDCGAGIGRVSKNFLLKIFRKVDMVEQCTNFVEQAKTEEWTVGNVDRFINLGLQEFTPENGRYDMIWIQWVMGHLTDDDLVEFFKRCKKGIKANGLIGLKENTALRQRIYDEEDSSVTRTDAEYKRLFTAAGLRLIKEAKQTDFPPSLFPVKMYMLESIQ